MFYDESAKGRLRPTAAGLRSSTVRGAAILAAAVLMPPFIALAIAPMLLMLLPVAFVAIPIMVPAFFGGAHSNHNESIRHRKWHPPLLLREATLLP
jgi:hypothetical protein